MGIAKVLQSLGLKKQAAAPAAPVTPGGVDVVPGVQGQLVDEKDNLEIQKKDIEQQIAAVDQKMATAPSTPQPQGDITMDPITQTPVDETKPAAAPAPVETPAAAPAPIAPAASVETDKKHEGTETAAEEKKEEEAKKKASFAIRFSQGKTFKDSYFIAEHNGEFRACSAARIIPANVQERILKTIAATGNPPTDVVTPTDIIDQMTGQGVNSLETFDQAVKALETPAVVAASVRRTAAAVQGPQMAWNESEVKTEKGDPKKPLSAVQQSEMEAGRKMHPAPSGEGSNASKVKQYYGRLQATGGEPTVALNPQSSQNVKDKIDFMRKALEEMKQQKDVAEDKAKKAEDKIGSMEKEKSEGDSAQLIESIVKDLISKKLIDEKGEQGAVAALSKIDRKSLPQVASLLKLLGKTEKAEMPGMGMDDKMPAVKPAAPANPFGAEKLPKASMRPVPPSFLREDGQDGFNPFQ